MNNHYGIEKTSIAAHEEQNDRILARKLARELTAEELAEVAGGMRSLGGTSYSGPCCCADECCA